jgi:hypothetical protein
MEIDRLSASAMKVLEMCPSRFKADQVAGHGAEESGYAAKVGTSCHYAAEQYVKYCIMQPKYSPEWSSLEIFLMYGYMQNFGNTDYSSKTFLECREMMERWYKRMENEWPKFTVLSTENKQSFPVPTSRGDRPFNYIFDRFDQLEETEFRVVDYKTLGRPLSPLQLHDKLQARVYGLAAQILHPNSTRVWVQFDMLRWEGTIGTVFTRDQNIETWNRIVAAFEEGYKIPDDADNVPPEVLNEECGFCIKKTTCDAVLHNAAAGGVHTYSTYQEMVEARALLQLQKTSADAAVKELDKQLLAYAESAGLTEISTPLVEGRIVLRPTRHVDAQQALNIVGPEMFAKYGGVDTPKIGMSDYDALLKDPELPPEHRTELENLITREYGDPWFQTKPKRK